MRNPFRAMIKNPDKTTYDGKDDDEQILFIVRESLITYIPKFVFIAIMLILPMFILPAIREIRLGNQLIFGPSPLFVLTLFWYVITLGFAIQFYVNWFFNVFIVSNKKIVDIDVVGLSYKNISECTLQNIEDVTSRIKSNFGTVFDIGDVYVQTAAEEREFEFVNVDNPASIRDLISDLVSNLKHHEPNN